MSSTTGARPPLRRLRRTEFLPPDEHVEIPYRFTPKLALRVGILGLLALAVFAVLLFRLWALQVLSGTHYLAEAQNNQIRTVRIEAPRGTIVDKRGRPLVTNVPGTIVRVWPQDLPKTWARQLGELRRLAGVLNMSPRTIVGLLRGHASDPLTPVTIKSGVHRAQAAYILEHQDEYRGVDVHSTTLRHYPHLALGAHILGHVGEISPEQLKEKPYRRGDYRPGDRIGQGGVEGVYDGYLRGKAGLAQLRVDASGRPRGVFKPRQQPQPGDTLRLTIDLQLQQAAERAIKDGIDLAHKDGCYGCWASNGGAIVAIDPRNGAIRALASYPTYKPSVYVGRVHIKKLNAEGLTPKTAKKDNFPALDRAISGLYPAGSTFKVITALAAMQERIISPVRHAAVHAHLLRAVANGRPVLAASFKNWDPNVNQPMDLMTALEASCDTYFYQLGYEFFQLPKRPRPPAPGVGRALRDRQADRDRHPRGGDGSPADARVAQAHVHAGRPTRSSWQVDRLWKPGNSIQLAIGQGDLQLTPLQLARVYALIANGGKLVTPHVAGDVEQTTNDNQAVVKWRFPVRHPQPVGLDPTALAAVRDGLLRATHGIERDVDRGLRQLPVHTSPARRERRRRSSRFRAGRIPDTVSQSWWCGYGPIEDPKLVVCALIENGGHGGTAAAPAALRCSSSSSTSHARSARSRGPPTDGRVRHQGRDPRPRGARRLAWSPRDLDWLLLGAVGALVGVGLWAIAGITSHDVTGDPNYYLVRQGIFALLGGIAFLVALFVDPELYRRHKWWVYGVMTGGMAFVILVGEAARGSRRWIDLGFFRFQPSEFGKLLFILFLAAFLADNAKRLDEWRTTAATIGLGLVPLLLVFLQPDLGTALVYSIAILAALFLAGTRWTHLAVIGLAAALAVTAVLWFLPAGGIHILKPYQETRFTAFLHPGNDPSGSGYNINQSLIGVGAGGLTGRGVTGSTQTNFNYLPEHATDFAFSSYAEQRGFAGGALLLGLYLLVVWRGLRIVTIARDRFSAIAAGTIVVAFLFQVFVNVGMTIGLAPITGIPLPFVSVGGSSMITNLAAMGVLLAIGARSRARPRASRRR